MVSMPRHAARSSGMRNSRGSSKGCRLRSSVSAHAVNNTMAAMKPPATRASPQPRSGPSMMPSSRPRVARVNSTAAAGPIGRL